MDRLQGAGVYYGAGIVEARSCKDEDVYIVGGANSAGQAAMHFSSYARRVVMLVRGESLAATMSRYLIDHIEQTPNIEVQTGASVVEVHGDARLEAISIKCHATGAVDRVKASSLFIFIGAEPRTNWLEGVVERDDRGFILTGADLLREGKRPQGLDSRPRSGLARNQRPRRLRGGRRPPWIGEAGRLRRRRRLHRDTVRASVSEQGVRCMATVTGTPLH